jgi:ATP-dependent helicase YprA (DUF1998 family)
VGLPRIAKIICLSLVGMTQPKHSRDNLGELFRSYLGKERITETIYSQTAMPVVANIGFARSVSEDSINFSLVRNHTCRRFRQLDLRGGTILYRMIITPLKPASCDTRAIAAQLTFSSVFLRTLPERAYLKTTLVV